MSNKINLNNTINLINLLESYNIYLPSNILYDISFNLENNTYLNKHLSLLIDNKTKKILTYGFNYYLKSDKFPFSLHSEINTINKHYKKKLTKNLIKTKKILIIIKLSKILYSTKLNTLEYLNKLDLIRQDFKLSAGFKQSFNN